MGLETFHNLKMGIRRLALLADVGSMYTGCGSSLVPRPRGLGTRLGPWHWNEARCVSCFHMQGRDFGNRDQGTAGEMKMYIPLNTTFDLIQKRSTSAH